MAEVPKTGEQGNDNTLSGTLLGSMGRFFGDAKNYVESKKKPSPETPKVPGAEKAVGKQEAAAVVVAEAQQRTEQLKTTVSKQAFLKKLDVIYNEGIAKVSGLSYPDAIINKAKADLLVKYNFIKSKAEACKTDDVLRNNKEILEALNTWILELQNINMPDITGDAVAGLGLLKADISETQTPTTSEGTPTPGVTASAKPESTKTSQTTAEEKEKKNKFTETLKGFGVPAAVAGIIAGLFGFFGSFEKKDGMLAKVMDFISSPTDGLMAMFGIGDKKDDKTKTADNKGGSSEMKKGEIFNDDGKKTVNYKNDRVAIALKGGKVESVVIGGASYNLKLKDTKNSSLSQVSFVQNDKGDFIKFGAKEIDMLAFAQQVQTGNLENSYILEKEFNIGDDLKLERIA